MSARSTRFHIGTIAGGDYRALYTVPTAKRAVIKFWSVLPAAAANGWARLYGSNLDAWALDELPTVVGQMARATERYIVLNPGNVLWGRHSGTSSEHASLYVAGILLDV